MDAACNDAYPEHGVRCSMRHVTNSATLDLNIAPKRFGEVLLGQDFKMLGGSVVFRRTQGLFAAPVTHIGGHVNGYGSTGFPFNRNMLVELMAAQVQP